MITNTSIALLEVGYQWEFISFSKEVKVSSPDYKDIPSEEAFKDFNARIKHYQDFYIPIDLEKERWINLI